MHELRGQRSPTLRELVPHLSHVDLVIVEGFKSETHAKLEVHRTNLGKPVLAPTDQSVVAIAADKPLAGVVLTQFAIHEIDAITEFVLGYLGMPARKS